MCQGGVRGGSSRRQGSAVGWMGPGESETLVGTRSSEDEIPHDARNKRSASQFHQQSVSMPPAMRCSPFIRTSKKMRCPWVSGARPVPQARADRQCHPNALGRQPLLACSCGSACAPHAFSSERSALFWHSAAAVQQGSRERPTDQSHHARAMRASAPFRLRMSVACAHVRREPAATPQRPCPPQLQRLLPSLLRPETPPTSRPPHPRVPADCSREPASAASG